MNLGSGDIPEWIAVDWGTSNLRVWAMDKLGGALGRKSSSCGMNSVTDGGYESALADVLGGSLNRQTPIVCCGMVGSRQGWMEAPYRATPCGPISTEGFVRPAAGVFENVAIVSGLKQVDPPDVMRGEETQIAGFLSENPGFEGVLCLPGTHTKWAKVRDGKVIYFKTLMTGELYSLLARHSVLRHSVVADAWDDGAFEAGVVDGVWSPENLTARLFGVRASGLLSEQAQGVGNARISGLLIGAELAATRDLWSSAPVAIIGDGQMADGYRKAMISMGCEPSQHEAEAMTLAGLREAHLLINGGGDA